MKIISWDIGIENLAYCIVEDKKIIKWNKIDILSSLRKNYECCGKLKDGTSCGKKATLTDDNNQYYCGTHKKQGINSKSIIKHHICSIFNKNSKKCKSKAFYKSNTTDEVTYYCKKHSNNIDNIEPYYTLENVPFFDKTRLLIDKLNNEKDILDIEYVVIENQPVHKNPIMKSIQMILYTYYLMKMDEYGITKIHLLNATEKMKVYNGPKIECVIKDKHSRNKFLSKQYCKYILEQMDDNSESLNYYNSFTKQDDIADTYLQAIYFLNKNNTIS